MNQYCVTWHNDKVKTGGLTREKVDFEHVAADTETLERVVRKVRTGMMPPAGVFRFGIIPLVVAIDKAVGLEQRAMASLLS